MLSRGRGEIKTAKTTQNYSNHQKHFDINYVHIEPTLSHINSCIMNMNNEVLNVLFLYKLIMTIQISYDLSHVPYEHCYSIRYDYSEYYSRLIVTQIHFLHCLFCNGIFLSFHTYIIYVLNKVCLH
jgi:hypothetical protein